MRKKAEVSWNRCCNQNENTVFKTYDKTDLDSSKTGASRSNFSRDNIEPQTSAEFLNTWKNLSDFQQKFEYLLRLRWLFEYFTIPRLQMTIEH